MMGLMVDDTYPNHKQIYGKKEVGIEKFKFCVTHLNGKKG
jgi:hypothetical protein